MPRDYSTTLLHLDSTILLVAMTMLLHRLPLPRTGVAVLLPLHLPLAGEAMKLPLYLPLDNCSRQRPCCSTHFLLDCCNRQPSAPLCSCSRSEIVIMLLT